MDNFKIYNDTLGHQRGDEALKEIAELLNQKCRRGDIACRYGGEEFSIIMPFTHKEDALLISERLRSEVEKFFLEKKAIKKHPMITISLGIATFPGDATDKNLLIDKADNALYEAKKTGKNRTCLYKTEVKKFFDKFQKGQK